VRRNLPPGVNVMGLLSAWLAYGCDRVSATTTHSVTYISPIPVFYLQHTSFLNPALAAPRLWLLPNTIHQADQSALDAICNMSAYSDIDGLFSTELDSFEISGRLFQTAAPAKCTQTETQCDFLAFLSIAQNLEIDFLPITWQPALDNIGQGGTARIPQALINLQMSFAFKRLVSTAQAQTEMDEIGKFRALIAEISVLRHPSIRNHPNIIRLEGVCWDVVSNSEKVWPVLVFEKAQHGDLHTFMGQAEGKRLTIEERLNVCIDIARAVMDMHSSSKY
jgi:hypothetical protein